MISRRGEPWTDIDDDELRRLLASGATMPAIARQLGRSQEAVGARRTRLAARGG